MKWIEALKKYNEDLKKKDPSHKWIIPKKGTKHYDAVKKLMGK